MKLFFTLLTNLFCFQLFAGEVNDNVSPGESKAITLSVTIINTTCQKYNGKIIVQASGGIAPYAYTISGPFAPQPSGVFFNLPAGTYTVTATDAVLDVASQIVTLTNTFTYPTAFSLGTIRPTGCNTFDGAFTMGASGGVAPYTYSLDNITYQSSNVFSNLTAGAYKYVVKDANGCTSIPPVLLNPVVIINGNCPISIINGVGGSFSCNPKSATLYIGTPTGGTAPYTYSHDGINYQTSNVFSNLSDGIFTFWIKDITGLIFLYSISWLDDCPTPFLVSNLIQAAHCGQNGSITVTASEGTPPYLYSLDGINFQTSNQFTGLAPGLYTVTVKDFYNLIATRLATVPNNCAVVTAVTTNSTCGYSNGKIVAQASNGTAPYQFSLDGINYSANNIFPNLPAGNYTAYTKDATGAVGTATVVISNIAGPMITSVNITPSGCDNKSGIVNVTAVTGTGPFVYSIDGSSFQSSPVFNGLAPGAYIVTVKDANNCLDQKSTIVTTAPDVPVVNLGRDTILCEGQTLVLDAANTNASYLWQDGSTQPTFIVTQKGRYNVSVTIQSCTVKDTIDIGYQLIPVFSLGSDRRLCSGNKFVLKPEITNGASTSGLSYLWQDGSTTPTFTTAHEGLYRLELGNTCGSTSDDVNVVKGVCDLYMPNVFTPNNDGVNDIFKPGYGDNVLEFKMEMFNRYGQLVFKTNDKLKGWDGKVNDKTQQAGTYTWIILYKTVSSSQWQNLSGTVILLK